jgi:Uma2 family endonuclease
VCGEPRFHEKHKTVLLNPRVLIEVLSPSAEAYDRGDKWTYYQLIPSLTDYVLVAQHRAQIEHYALDSDGSRRYTSETNTTSEVVIASINCRVPLAEVFGQIKFPSAPSRLPIQSE